MKKGRDACARLRGDPAPAWETSQSPHHNADLSELLANPEDVSGVLESISDVWEEFK